MSPNLVPIPGPITERVTPGQRPRPNYGHPHAGCEQQEVTIEDIFGTPDRAVARIRWQGRRPNGKRVGHPQGSAPHFAVPTRSKDPAQADQPAKRPRRPPLPPTQEHSYKPGCIPKVDPASDTICNPSPPATGAHDKKAGRHSAHNTDRKHQAMSIPVFGSLQSRTALVDRYGNNALLLYALEMRFGIDDILTTAESCITDGPDDRKCDAIYIDRDTACAVIAQCYMAERPTGAAPANKAADLNAAVSWILAGAPTDMNEGLRAAAEDLNSAIQAGEIERVELWYCHNLTESINVQTELDTAAKTAKGLLATRHAGVQITVGALEVGVTKLDEWYTSIQRPILVADKVTVEVDGWFEESGTDWTAVCTSIPARWLTQLNQKYGDKLFSANVRGYMPSRRTARNINFNMEETAKTTPGQFWAFNNGVTILVNEFSVDNSDPPSSRLVLDGVAIVNGAQTTGALSRSDSPRLADASVLARFIRCDNQETVESLIRFNNSQNPIQASDFRSTDQHARATTEPIRQYP